MIGTELLRKAAKTGLVSSGIRIKKGRAIKSPGLLNRSLSLSSRSEFV